MTNLRTDEIVLFRNLMKIGTDENKAIYSIYQLSLKLLGQSVLELSVTESVGDWHDLWPWPLTYWPE